MPEGHTIHRLAQDIGRDLGGQRVAVSTPQGRFLDAPKLDGRVLRGTEAIGKHLFIRFAGGRVVHIHLGLFGKFRRHVGEAAARSPRPTTRLRLVGDHVTWDLAGPTCCELLSPAAKRTLLARLGADPLAATADVEKAWQIVHATKRAIGAVLLDQRVVAGIGNVYRAEILYLLGIHPETPARHLDRATFDKLWDLTRSLLARGVKEKRIVTVDAPTKKRLKRSEALHVYARRECRGCAGAVTRILLANRTIYVCERCQVRLGPCVGLGGRVLGLSEPA